MPCVTFHTFHVFTLSAFASRAASYSSVSRAGSVRDRVRKFTEPATVSTENRSVQRSIHRGALSGCADSDSQDISSCLHSTSTDRGVDLDQSQRAVGGPQSAAENVRSASGSSEEGESPKGTASSDTQEVQGDPQSNMKAFLTIEIKDGRTSATQTSSSSSSSMSMSGAMPRILTGSAAQRAGRLSTASDYTYGTCMMIRAHVFCFCNTHADAVQNQGCRPP